MSPLYIAGIVGLLSYWAATRTPNTPNPAIVTDNWSDLGSLHAYAITAAQNNGVPADIFLKLIDAESNWRWDAVSPVGAYGIAQFMPLTAKQLLPWGDASWNPYTQLDASAKYLNSISKYLDNTIPGHSWREVVAGYNAGMGFISRNPEYASWPAETQNYVNKIMG